MKTITKISLMALVLLGLNFQKASAQCTAGFIFTYGANGVVTFTSTSAPTNSLTSYYWNFGNGSTYTASGISGATAIQTYTANGTYTVSLFFITVPSCSNIVTQTIAITNATTSGGCNLFVGYSNYLTGAPGQMGFNNNCTGTLSSTTFTWSYGDGSQSFGTNGLHTYTANGNYVVTLAVNNNTTPVCAGTKTINAVITTACNLIASYNYTQMPNGVVNFQSTSTGTTASYVYQWTFGDGGTGTGVTTAHTYTNGTYNAYLTVKNSSISPTCIDTINQTISVTNNTCTLGAGFTFTQTTGGLVNFSNNSSGTNGSTTYNWNFGNGTTSNSSGNPSSTYLNGGVHVVKLTLINSASPTCSSVVTNSINITTVSCTANPNFTLTYGGTPGIWNATPAYPWNVANAKWTWGDGSNSFALYTSHVYSVSANYNICLTVTVTCGATASACSTYSVYRSAAAMIYQVNVIEPELKSVDNNNNVGISNVISSEMRASVYPNPANNEVALMVTGLKSESSNIRLTDALGREVIAVTHQNQNGNLIEIIDLNSQSSGVYFLTVQSGSDLITKKIIVNK